MKLCQAVRIALEAEILGERASVLCYTHIPVLYVIYTGHQNCTNKNIPIWIEQITLYE